MTSTNQDVLIKAEHVSKKFCRSLKRSLWYGARDVAHALMPWKEASSSNDGNGLLEFPKPELRRDEFWALQDISFELRRGECLGLIGHNGAGKSTLLKVLNSLVRPNSGRITMIGSVGALIELSAGFNPILTGRENVFNQAALLGFSKKETESRFDEIVDFSELESALDSPVRNYSSGMRMRLGFAISATMEPDILLLDEILAVGDIGFQIKCHNKINELAENCAIVFVSHAITQVAKVCSQLIVLENGEISFQGSNVKEGIGVYYDQFEGFQSHVREQELLRITRFDLRPGGESTSNDIQVLKHGDDLLIDIELDGKFPSNQKFSLVLKVLDQSFIPVINCQTERYFFKERLTLRLQNLMLSPGTYTFEAFTLLHKDESNREEVVSYYNSFRTFRVSGELLENYACFQLRPEVTFP